MSITCPICLKNIPLIPDGLLRYCSCKLLGVVHTPHYTRYIGLNINEAYDPKVIKEIREKLNINV
jgi:hypothetical protein